MKTSYTSRLLAALLVLTMLIGMVGPAFAETGFEMNLSQYMVMSEEAVQSYVDRLMLCDDYAGFVAIRAELTDDQYATVYSRLDAATQAKIDSLNADLFDDHEFSQLPQAVNVTSAGPVLSSGNDMEALYAMVTAADETASEFDANSTNVNNVHISKTAKANADGTYTVTLTAFQAGKLTPTPCDIVLVLDRSGSMNYIMDTSSLTNKVAKDKLDKSKTYAVWNSTNTSTRVVHRVAYDSANGVWRRIKNSSKDPTTSTAPTWQNAYEDDTFYYSPDSSDKTNVKDTALGKTKRPRQFYKEEQRRDSLKSAVNEFLKIVKADSEAKYGENSTEGHRVSIVTFASTGKASTKLNLTTDIPASLTTTLYPQPTGNTYINEGMELAEKQLQTAYNEYQGARKRVCIVFTDGYPGSGDWSKEIAYTATKESLSSAKTIKNNYDTTIYTVSIFEGADASVSISKNNNNNDALKANQFMLAMSSKYPKAVYSKHTLDDANERLYFKSYSTTVDGSYYMSAGDSEGLENAFKNIGNQISAMSGEVDLVAGKTKLVDNVSPYFKIAKTSSGAPQIKVYTSAYKGNKKWDTPVELANANPTVSGKTVSVSAFDYNENLVTEKARDDGTRGKKLIVEIIVEPENEFLGGNAVPTNSSAQITYTGTSEIDIVSANKFPSPEVDVSLLDIYIKAEDKHVYLYDDPTRDELTEDSEVWAIARDGVTKIPFNLKEEDDSQGGGQEGGGNQDEDGEGNGEEDEDGNQSGDGSQSGSGSQPDNNGPMEVFGLDWRDDYATPTVTHTEKKDGPLEADTTYTLKVTLDPEKDPVSTDGSTTNGVTTKSKSDEANIYVYKPELKFKDTTHFYGDTAPTNPADLEEDNKVSELWKHGSTLDTEVDMLGEKPALTLTYDVPEGKIADGKINTKQDIPVNVVVTVPGAPAGEAENENITFLHKDCDPACDFDAEESEFLLHVKTCQLTVQKEGGASNEPYVFTVKRNGEDYTELTLLGDSAATIYELPIGTYSIEEAEDWSWRYTTTYGVQQAELSASNTSALLNCENKNRNDQWLGDYSDVVANEKGVAKGGN